MTRAQTFAVFVAIVCAMVALDYATKLWATSGLTLGAPAIGYGPIALHLVHNTGAAFGMGQGAGAVFIGIAVVVCVAAVLWLVQRRPHGVLEVVGLALVVAGGIGNCINRVVTGYVVDFIQFTFIDFPVFNVADICVTCGVVLFLIGLIKGGFLSVSSSKDEDAR